MKTVKVVSNAVICTSLLFGLSACTNIQETVDVTQSASLKAHKERSQPICQTTTIPDDIPEDERVAWCGDYAQEELCQTKEFWATESVLQTELNVQKVWQCVPLYTPPDSDTGAPAFWSMTAKHLRNYGYRDERNDFSWNYPGPTYWLRRNSMNDATPAYRFPGDKFQMTLLNNLAASDPRREMECVPPANKENRFGQDVAPNCFHGNSTTNFHFHGFHVSPQYHQDYVLLKLYPYGSTGVDLSKPSNAVGSYDYDLDSLPDNQAEGTHWYHAHKHGSTALQVLNGMSGTFLIQGPLDYWLNDFFGYYDYGQTPQLKDHLLVIQQINSELDDAPHPLVNGQGNPNVTIQRGETQRWRFVAATMNVAAELTLDFGTSECLIVKQFAMDGVQFGRDNYDQQPLLNAEHQITLSPGNRADFLVQVPVDVPEHCLSDGFMHVTFARTNMVDLTTTTHVEAGGTLFRVKVDSRPVEMKPPPVASEWPALPGFLAPPKPTSNKTIVYSQHDVEKAAPIFKIDDQQFEDACIPAKMTANRGTQAKWTVVNKRYPGDGSGPYTGKQIAHPFHIHTNPFFVTRYGDTTYQHGIWKDVIGLPKGTTETASSVDMLMTFDDFTGSYVQHCHILGHEDRGMMSLVQTVCDSDNKYGTPLEGAEDDCALPVEPAIPTCP